MAGQTKKMVTGFNHNIKHKGQVFHVQTEDSGIDNPHIITHLFLGGNILASKKTSYADIVHADNLTEVVRALMEEQHKEMLRNLINGAYDEVIERYGAKAWQPGVVDPGGATAPAGPPNAPAAGRPAPSSPPTAPPPSVAQAEAATIRPAPPPPLAAQANARPPVEQTARVTPEQAAAAGRRAESKPAEPAGDTIFGEDLISERSLDEVILSYLAEDSGDG